MELVSSMAGEVRRTKKSNSLDVFSDFGLQVLLILPYNQNCTIYIPIPGSQRATYRWAFHSDSEFSSIFNLIRHSSWYSRDFSAWRFKAFASSFP